jgi:biotin carboxyl carrier protein
MVGKTLRQITKLIINAFWIFVCREGKAHANEEPKAGIVNVDSRFQIGAQSNHLSQSNAYIDGKVIYAPDVGIFYRAPKPGAPPFVEVGDSVTEHTIIGIIEVMKVMSSVEAGVKGECLQF